MVVLAGVWAGLVGLLIAAGEIVIHSATLTHFDQHTTRVVVSWRTAALNSVMKAMTWFGSWVALAVAAGLIAALVITRRLPVLAIFVGVFAWAGEAGGVRIGKEVVSRHRPPPAIWLVRAHGWSFPSGHAAASCLAFTVLAVCVATLTGHRAVRMLAWLAAGLAVAATAFSRVELGVHWMTDVLAGVVFVICWLTAISISLGSSLKRPAVKMTKPVDEPEPRRIEGTSGHLRQPRHLFRRPWRRPRPGLLAVGQVLIVPCGRPVSMGRRKRRW
jgi:membrane-associated phospholipid phosphatase